MTSGVVYWKMAHLKAARDGLGLISKQADSTYLTLLVTYGAQDPVPL